MLKKVKIGSGIWHRLKCPSAPHLLDHFTHASTSVASDNEWKCALIRKYFSPALCLGAGVGFFWSKELMVFERMGCLGFLLGMGGCCCWSDI